MGAGTMWKECILSGSPTSLLQGGGAQVLTNYGVLFYLCTNPLTTKFNVVTDMGRGLVLVVSHGSIQNLLPIHTWFDLERLNSARKNAWDGRVFLSAMHPAPNGLDTRVSQFWGLSVFIPTPFDVERPNSAW